MLQKGGVGCVYLAEDVDTGDQFALKIQSTPAAWEFYIAAQLHQRLPNSLRNLVVRTQSLHIFNDASIMLMDYCSGGSLQDEVNAHLQCSKRMSEELVMHYTIEMLRIVEECHRHGIIHTDLKPDQFLLRRPPRTGELPRWDPQKPGWEDVGLQVIDFGYSVDQRMYPLGTRFQGKGHADTFDCIEMREGRPWTFQPDLFGLCACVHVLLHAKYMTVKHVEKNGGTVWLPTLSLNRRHYQKELWDNLMERLINGCTCGGNSTSSGEATARELAALRHSLEQYLTTNPKQAESLRQALMQPRLAPAQGGQKRKPRPG
eukprot:TRINITY_DN5409_c0_g1_i1.p1 TRINITY_DN5409_c0_g1~~TRINITY_DN5409_c0_g1_i1.p1  ORF type:complete len:316 (-),score=82.37 TRINITY_DN5409_c0_g1_i1:39-986(-)